MTGPEYKSVPDYKVYLQETERESRLVRLRDLAGEMYIWNRPSRKAGIVTPLSGIIPTDYPDIFAACEELRDRLDLEGITHTIGLAMEGNMLGLAMSVVTGTKTVSHTLNYTVEDEGIIHFNQYRQKPNGETIMSDHIIARVPKGARVLLVDDEYESYGTANQATGAIVSSGYDRSVGAIAALVHVGNHNEFLHKMNQAQWLLSQEKKQDHYELHSQKSPLDALIFKHNILPKHLYNCNRDSGEFKFIEPDEFID
ncbi:hypothetical protein K9M79_08855 [Candidatus Woesearchaeota archaeon]|nr:hypothetical protein [Candidatus Woesearchaeota archaeon]